MMFKIFLGVALCAAPFYMRMSSPSGSMPTLAQPYLMLILTVIGACLFGLKVRHKNIAILGISFAACAFMSKNPFGVLEHHQMAVSAFGVIFLALMAGNITIKHKDLVVFCLGFICLFESIWIFLNHFSIDPYATWFSFISDDFRAIKTLSWRPIMGSLGNPTHSAALVGCTLIFLPVWLWVIPVLALFLASSSLPIICASVSVVTFICYKYKKTNYLLVMGAGLFLSALALITNLIPKDSFFSGTDRVAAWKTLIEMVGFQFIGKGFGFVPTEFSKFFKASEVFREMHNEWIELYAIGGLLAVVVGIYLILPVFKNRGNPAINACLIALLVNSLGNFTFHIAPLFMVFGACYALQLTDAKE